MAIFAWVCDRHNEYRKGSKVVREHIMSTAGVPGAERNEHAKQIGFVARNPDYEKAHRTRIAKHAEDPVSNVPV
eukprot:592563-Lingulodinium_polyedra.AAC.1